jgi:hypothetical protein
VIQAPPQRDATDYEALRSEALLGDVSHGHALLPRGLAAWLTEVSRLSHQALSIKPSHSVGASCRGSLSAAFASIVLRLTLEVAHA